MVVDGNEVKDGHLYEVLDMCMDRIKGINLDSSLDLEEITIYFLHNYIQDFIYL